MTLPIGSLAGDVAEAIVSDQTALSEIAEITAKRALHESRVVILSAAKRSRRISVQCLVAPLPEILRCFDFTQHDSADWFDWRVIPRQKLDASNQTAVSEVTEITAGGTLHKVDGKLEQTNFPRVVYALDNRAERFVFVFDLSPGAIDHRVD
jgi:hypothetical protein